MALIQGVSKIYGMLLRLFPREFQNEFKEEMEDVFSANLEEVAKTGATLVVRACFFELFDLPANLLVEHLSNLRKGNIMKTLPVVIIIVSLFAVALGFTVWSWNFTTSRLKSSVKSFGTFPSPTAAMETEIREGWVGIQEAWIRDAGPGTALDGGPHVWFVTACVWAESRADGSPVGSSTDDFDFPGGYFLETQDGWVPMSEGSAPFVGFWMKVFGLAGNGGGQIIHEPPSTPVCVRKAG